MDCFKLLSPCCKLCTNSCCPCCRQEITTENKFPLVEYYKPSEALDVVDMPERPFREVPIKKIFSFPQEYKVSHDFPEHLASSGIRCQPIVNQPLPSHATGHSADLTTMYISGRGRTLGTVSEIQGISPLVTPEPPFTPPASPLARRKESAFVHYSGDESAIQFSLYFDIQRRTLTLHLIGAYNLPPKDVWGSTDYFVSSFVLPNRDKIYQTNVVSSTSPIFNQIFDFESVLSEELSEQVMVFQVFSRDKAGREHLVGTVTVLLSQADLFGVHVVKKLGDGRELLQQFVTGDMLLSLTYNPQQQVIQGIVLKATNLPRLHKWGLADPYVKIYLLHKQKRVKKWKSSIKRSTLAPVFNESFEFNVIDMPLSDLSIEIFVMNHDTFRRNDIMGIVFIGPNSLSDLGVSHYNEIMTNSLRPISHWHKLIPHSQPTRKRHKSNTM